MTKFPEKEILEATIKSTNKRIIDIHNMLQGDTCPVCTLLNKNCRRCPINRHYKPTPSYSCSMFINDIGNIREELEYQLNKFQNRLKRLKAKKEEQSEE